MSISHLVDENCVRQEATLAKPNQKRELTEEEQAKIMGVYASIYTACNLNEPEKVRKEYSDFIESENDKGRFFEPEMFSRFVVKKCDDAQVSGTVAFTTELLRLRKANNEFVKSFRAKRGDMLSAIAGGTVENFKDYIDLMIDYRDATEAQKVELEKTEESLIGCIELSRMVRANIADLEESQA